MEALDTTDLTVLVGLVRRAKRNAEKRWARRHHLDKSSPGGDPAQTKVNKLAVLLAKLVAMQAH